MSTGRIFEKPDTSILTDNVIRKFRNGKHTTKFTFEKIAVALSALLGENKVDAKHLGFVYDAFRGRFYLGDDGDIHPNYRYLLRVLNVRPVSGILNDIREILGLEVKCNVVPRVTSAPEPVVNSDVYVALSESFKILVELALRGAESGGVEFRDVLELVERIHLELLNCNDGAVKDEKSKVSVLDKVGTVPGFEEFDKTLRLLVLAIVASDVPESVKIANCELLVKKLHGFVDGDQK